MKSHSVAAHLVSIHWKGGGKAKHKKKVTKSSELSDQVQGGVGSWGQHCCRSGNLGWRQVAKTGLAGQAAARQHRQLPTPPPWCAVMCCLRLLLSCYLQLQTPQLNAGLEGIFVMLRLCWNDTIVSEIGAPVTPTIPHHPSNSCSYAGSSSRIICWGISSDCW